MSRSSYRRYSHGIKAAIAVSGNANLFPELMIPRSSAYQWIAEGVDVPEGGFRHGVMPKADSDLLEDLDLISSLLKCVNEPLDLRALTDREKVALRLAMRAKRLAKYLGPSQLQKLQNQLFRCSDSLDGICVKRFPLKITRVELERMKGLYESVEWAHMPVCSLALKARRDGIVNCSPQTWGRYAKKFSWRRPFRKQKKRRQVSKGLKASRPHEIWQIDATEIVMLSSKKCYLQLIIDNYSRFVVGWVVLERISKVASIALINRSCRAFECSVSTDILLISDGGPENKGVEISLGKGRVRIQHRLAKHEIRNANTMVEVFFKTLKHDYLNHQVLKSLGDVNRAVGFFIDQHNRVIPRVSLRGLTPAERLAGESPKHGESKPAKGNSLAKARVKAHRDSHCNECG